MVLATKSKKSNFFVKFICILLSVICVAGAAQFACQIADVGVAFNDIDVDDFNGKPLGKSVCDSTELNMLIFRDIQFMDNEMALNDTETLKKDLEKYRAPFVSHMLGNYTERRKQYLANREEYIADAENEDYEDYPYEDSVFADSYTFDYNDDGISLNFCLSVNENDGITYDKYDEEAAEEKFNAIFDDFIYTDSFGSYVVDMYPDYYTDDAEIYVESRKKHEGVKYMDVEEVTEDYVLSHEYAYVVKDGKLTCSKALQPFFDKALSGGENVSSYFNVNYNYYFFVNPDAAERGGYVAAIDNAEKAKDVNLLNCTVWSILLLLLALAFAITAFIICGNRDKDGKIKLAFIDYVPVDLHLVLTAGAQFGIGVLFALCYDSIVNYTFPYEQYLYYSVYALTALIWLLFIEFMTSFIRVCKSEKKLYQNTLIYLVIKYLIVKPCKFVISKLKSFFTYKPAAFNKLLRRILISYGALNAFFILVILICAGNDAAGGACFFFTVSVAINIALLVYAVRYIKDLDKIITAAHFRQVPQVDYNKLPNSLKTLVNSLNYTNAELRTAVDKAVRDERMRTELITNVSHDLKTPLTSIISYVDLLKGCDIQDENAREYIEILDEKGGKLKRLIEDLIEASKITSGVINIEPMNINLSELATQAVVEHQQEFAENGLELVFKGDQKNIGAFADGTKTFRIIENLISNARKYSLRGTRVYADVYETQNFSIFEIKNTSAEPLDIPASELKQRFVRGDKSRANEGNGLGLSIAENLCTVQNGHLNITIDGDLFKAQVMLPKTKN